jgi:K+-transporting ATPase ATPase C chain
MEIRKAVTVITAFALVLCVIYPLAVWGIAQVFFPGRANGSLIKTGDKVTGSILIGQEFNGPIYFHPRPLASGGSNLGPLSEALFQQVAERVKKYREENHLPPGIQVPVDAITASASGLDPHISVENARLQAGRIAKAMGISREIVLALIEKRIENRQLGIFGEKRVNVLLLNLELEKIK